MIRKKKQAVNIGIFSSVIAILLITCVVFYNGYIYNKISDFTSMSLAETTTQQAFQFKSKFAADISAIELLAAEIARESSPERITKETLKIGVDKTEFENLTILGPAGKGYTNNGKDTNFSDREFFKRAMAGESFILSPTVSVQGTQRLIMASTPIKYKGEVKGVLVGTYSAEKLSAFFPPVNRSGYSYIVSDSGEIISSSISENQTELAINVFDMLNKAEFFDGEDFEELRDGIENELPGEARYNREGQNRVMYHMPIGVNNWSLLCIIPEAAISWRAGEITLATLLMSVVTIITFAVLIIRSRNIQNRSMRALEEIAYVDELTKAPTLAGFKLEAQRFIDENPGKKLLMVKFDIDKFKLVNEILGKEVGDLVIINLAKALKMNIAPGYDRYARVHDDEFLVLHEYEQAEELIHIRDKYQVIFATLMGDKFDYNIRMVSGHYYMESENCKDASEAIEKANIAHRRAKQMNTEICVYDETLIKEDIRKKDIEERMTHALYTGEFKVYLQPQYNLKNETISGAEALVRWKPENGSLIYPDEFIPIFEENGFVTSLDMYMFGKSCEIIRGWLDASITPVVVSVNFSRKHLSNSHFVMALCDIADTYSVPHRYLGIEITEGIFFDNKEVLLDVLERLHENNFTLIMDDFGTGYSSLGMLKNIPVDVIKIDKSFFDNMENEERAKVVLGYMIKMASVLNIQTVSEGVETKEMADSLREFGCDIAQGYYFARPMPAEELSALLELESKSFKP